MSASESNFDVGYNSIDVEGKVLLVALGCTPYYVVVQSHLRMVVEAPRGLTETERLDRMAHKMAHNKKFRVDESAVDS